MAKSKKKVKKIKCPRCEKFEKIFKSAFKANLDLLKAVDKWADVFDEQRIARVRLKEEK